MSAEPARYYAHAAGAAHGHTVEATSFETAALAFTEAWAPVVGPGDPIRILVQAEDGGPEHCFVVHLDDGDVEACG